MTARDSLHAAVQGGCKNLGRDDIGQIAPGFAADIVAFPTNKLAFAGAQHDVVAALIFCSPGADQVSVQSTLCSDPHSTSGSVRMLMSCAPGWLFSTSQVV